MHRVIQSLSAATFCLLSATVLATPPMHLITHNLTDAESNAYIDGTIPSQHPTRANSVSKVFWTAVKIACFGHVNGGKCSATVMMETNTPHSVALGTVYLDMATGDITPKKITANGYTLTVNGPGETTLTRDMCVAR